METVFKLNISDLRLCCISSSCWWDLCWPFCSPRVLLLGNVIHGFMALFSFPVLEVHSKARQNQTLPNCHLYLWEEIKRQKPSEKVSRHIPQNTPQVLCDIFDLSGLPRSGIRSLLCGAEGNSCTQWVPESWSIHQTWISASLNLASFQFLLKAVRHQCF